MSNNRLCKVLGIEKPIIGGPMAWVSLPPLVAAISENGGLGVGCVGAPDFVRAQIVATKKLTDKPFGQNTFMFPEMLPGLTKVFLDEKPAVVYADILFGVDPELAKKYFSIWKEAGLKIVFKASDIKDGLIAEAAGADVIIIKGWEGGGHSTYEATTVLIPQAAETYKVPVVGSGGIADGRGMAAAIALGADGIEMGTVFMCAKEAPIHPNVKQRIIKAGDMETVICGYCTDEPSRQLKNKLSARLVAIENEHTKKEALEIFKQASAFSLKTAMTTGEIEEKGAIMIGQVAPLVKEIKSVKDIMDDTLKGYHATVAKLNKFEL